MKAPVSKADLSCACKPGWAIRPSNPYSQPYIGSIIGIRGPNCPSWYEDAERSPASAGILGRPSSPARNWQLQVLNPKPSTPKPLNPQNPQTPKPLNPKPTPQRRAASISGQPRNTLQAPQSPPPLPPNQQKNTHINGDHVYCKKLIWGANLWGGLSMRPLHILCGAAALLRGMRSVLQTFPQGKCSLPYRFCVAMRGLSWGVCSSAGVIQGSGRAAHPMN